mgnify:CR=1 FL=1
MKQTDYLIIGAGIVGCSAAYLLTKEGKKIYALHEKFHKDMVFALVKGLNENEMDVVAKALDNLESFVGKRFENGENK